MGRQSSVLFAVWTLATSASGCARTEAGHPVSCPAPAASPSAAASAPPSSAQLPLPRVLETLDRLRPPKPAGFQTHLDCMAFSFAPNSTRQMIGVIILPMAVLLINLDADALTVQQTLAQIRTLGKPILGQPPGDGWMIYCPEISSPSMLLIPRPSF